MLLRTTLCAFIGFGKGKIIAQNVGTKIGLIGHIYFGIFCTGCWPAPAVITMISVRTPVPLLMETVLAMMRSRTCEGTCGLMGVTAAEDGDWAESSREGPTQQLLIAVAFNDPRLLHLSWMRPSAAPRMTLPSQVCWQSRRKCVRNVVMRDI